MPKKQIRIALAYLSERAMGMDMPHTSAAIKQAWETSLAEGAGEDDDQTKEKEGLNLPFPRE